MSEPTGPTFPPHLITLADCVHRNAYPVTFLAGITGPTQAAADAIAERLDLERFERDGWPTVARDLADAATPALLRWACTYLHAAAAQEADDSVGVGYARAADHLSDLADRIDPAAATNARRQTLRQQLDQYAETLDQIGAAVAGRFSGPPLDAIRDFVRKVRPEAIDLWNPALDNDRPATP